MIWAGQGGSQGHGQHSRRGCVTCWPSRMRRASVNRCLGLRAREPSPPGIPVSLNTAGGELSFLHPCTIISRLFSGCIGHVLWGFPEKAWEGGTFWVSVEDLVSLSLTPASSSPDLGPHHGPAPWASPMSVPQPLGAGWVGGTPSSGCQLLLLCHPEPFPHLALSLLLTPVFLD